MTNELKINGMQNFMGTDIPIVEGGFGENCRVVTDKTISEIHQMRIGHIRENINNNIKRFKENIDFIDSKKLSAIPITIYYSILAIPKCKFLNPNVFIYYLNVDMQNL